MTVTGKIKSLAEHLAIALEDKNHAEIEFKKLEKEFETEKRMLEESVDSFYAVSRAEKYNPDGLLDWVEATEALDKGFRVSCFGWCYNTYLEKFFPRNASTEYTESESQILCFWFNKDTLFIENCFRFVPSSDFDICKKCWVSFPIDGTRTFYDDRIAKSQAEPKWKPERKQINSLSEWKAANEQVWPRDELLNRWKAGMIMPGDHAMEVQKQQRANFESSSKTGSNFPDHLANFYGEKVGTPFDERDESGW